MYLPRFLSKSMKKLIVFVFLFAFACCIPGCASTSPNDSTAGREAYPDDSIFNFLYVSDQSSGIYDVEIGMPVETVLDVLEIAEDQVQIFEPVEDPETGIKIDETRVHVELDRTFAEFPDYRVDIILSFDENGYQKAQIGLRYYDIVIDEVNDIVDSTVDLVNGHFKSAKMLSSGDYSEGAAMDYLDSRCLIQWITDDASPISASFSLQDMTESEAVAADNVFGISFQVTA